MTRTRPIGELVTIVGGGTPTRTQAEFYGGGVPWVTPKDMKSWDITGSQVTLTEEGVKQSPAKLIEPDAVLVVVRSGVLKHTLPVGVSRVPVTLNQDMKALICRPGLHPDYLARYLKWRAPEILRSVRATTADNFPVAALRQLEMPVPALEEQRRISAILNLADGLRVRRQAALGASEELVAALYEEMVVDHPSRAQWSSRTVAQLASHDSGAIRTGPFGSQLLHSEFTDSGVAVLGIDNAVADEFRWGKPRFVSEAKYTQLKRYTVHPGDVLITIMGTCGRCAVVPDDIPVAINTKHLCCITLDRAQCSPTFLWAAFKFDPEARSYLQRHAKGAVMAGLNMGIIKSLPVRVPPPPVQAAFERAVGAVHAFRAAQRSAQDQLDSLFVALADRAFAGELTGSMRADGHGVT